MPRIKSTVDLTYSDDGLFCTFYPETEDGKNAWNEAATLLGGNFRIYSQHKKATIEQLNAAGYSVTKAKKPTITFDDINLEELF